MALEFPRLALPPFPFSRRHWFYFADRDVGAPSISATCGLLTTLATTPEIDTLEWDYSELTPPGEASFRRPDGFLIAMAVGDTAAPWETGSVIRLSIQARFFVAPGWPNGTARSYALAAYRNTWQGEQATAWDQGATWKNVT